MTKRTMAKLLLALVPVIGAATMWALAGAAPVPQPQAPSPKPVAAAPQEPPLPAALRQAAAYPIKGVLTLDGPLEHGDYAWNEEGVPPGEILVTVDLAAQTLSVFRGGYEIGVAVILYGATDKPSPIGAFSITEKDADHVSSLYDAPMPYMLRLTNDGVAIHGSNVKWGSATHGCIGVPTDFARLLFNAVKLGDRVLITSGRTLKLGDSVPSA